MLVPPGRSECGRRDNRVHSTQYTSAPTVTSMPKRVDINEVTLAVLLTLAAFASAILL